MKTGTEMDKCQESRVRKKAIRRGYRLKKSRARLSLDNRGLFMLFNPYRNIIVAGEKFNLSLDEIEKFLDNE